jgi:hypothetical protein
MRVFPGRGLAWLLVPDGGRVKTLWQRGRWALIFEPGDLWFGLFYDRMSRRGYLGVPMLVLRYSRP